jgi:hypothetical protein
MAYTPPLSRLFAPACLAAQILSAVAPASSADLFKLADLTSAQRADLFDQADAYGLVTAMLNFCQRPPKLVERLTPIAEGCFEKESFTEVANRYNAAVVREAGRWDCSDKGMRVMTPKFEQKIDNLVSNVKTACRFRSFYKISFPRINLP